MNRPTWMIGLLLLLSLLLAGCGTSAAASSSAATVSCTLKQFVATFYQGPDKGPAVQGEFQVQMGVTGSLTGTVKQQGESPVNVVGQATGRAINLSLIWETIDFSLG